MLNCRAGWKKEARDDEAERRTEGVRHDAAQPFLDEGGGNPEHRLGAEPGGEYRGGDDGQRQVAAGDGEILGAMDAGGGIKADADGDDEIENDEPDEHDAAPAGKEVKARIIMTVLRRRGNRRRAGKHRGFKCLSGTCRRPRRTAVRPASMGRRPRWAGGRRSAEWTRPRRPAGGSEKSYFPITIRAFAWPAAPNLAHNLLFGCFIVIRNTNRGSSWNQLIHFGLAAAVGLAAPAYAVDEAAAEALARKSGCFKCHAIDKKKDGPPYKEIAGKYKGKADAEQNSPPT